MGFFWDIWDFFFHLLDKCTRCSLFW